MAWNEPGGGGDNKDPWGPRKKNDGPPDLDQVIKKIRERIGGFFGKKKGGGGNGVSQSGGGGSSFNVMWLLLIGLGIWLATGIYIVNPAEHAVVLRFGKPVVETIAGKEVIARVPPGPHWAFPYPIDRVEKIDTSKARSKTINPNNALMLTSERNLVLIQVEINYKITDIEKYLFKVKDPLGTLENQAVDSALREVVGGSKFNDIMSKGGGTLELEVTMQKQLQDIMDAYETGILITKANVSNRQPPNVRVKDSPDSKTVKDAYDEATGAVSVATAEIRAAEKDKAQAVLEAEGQKAKMLEEAKGYKEAIEKKAQGEANAFVKVLSEYEKAPDITRKRMYLETMQEVLAKTQKVIIKVKQGSNVLFLPLDRFIKSGDKNNVQSPKK